VDRAADILRRNKAQDRHLAGLGVDLDIAELGREAGSHAAGIDRGRSRDRAAGQRLLGRQLLQRQWREVADIAGSGFRLAVLPHDTLDIDIPDQCGAGAQLLDHLLTGVDDRHAGGEGDVRAAGHIRKGVSATIESTWS